MVNKIAVAAGVLVLLGLVLLGYYLLATSQLKSSFMKLGANAPAYKSQDASSSAEVGAGSPPLQQTARQTVPKSLPSGWE